MAAKSDCPRAGNHRKPPRSTSVSHRPRRPAQGIGRASKRGFRRIQQTGPTASRSSTSPYGSNRTAWLYPDGRQRTKSTRSTTPRITLLGKPWETWTPIPPQAPEIGITGPMVVVTQGITSREERGSRPPVRSGRRADGPPRPSPQGRSTID
jgi:hypothetical protein